MDIVNDLKYFRDTLGLYKLIKIFLWHSVSLGNTFDRFTDTFVTFKEIEQSVTLTHS